MTELSVAILWCAAQVTMFLCLAAPVYLAARWFHPRAATFVAAGSLAAVIALSLLAGSPWPRWSLADSAARGLAENRAIQQPPLTEPNAATATPPGSTTGESADLSQPGGVESPPPPTTLSAIWQTVRTAVTNRPTHAADEPPATWSRAVVALAGIGVAVGAIHLLGGLVAVRRLVARSRAIDGDSVHGEVAALRAELGIAGPVALRESREVVTPATVGWRRPAILLPAAWRQWDAVERRSVLAHELAHVAEKDFAAHLVARLAIACHLYHPLVRWFARRLQIDQELAADAAAVRLLGDRDAYLHALANLALATPMHRLAGPARTFIPSRSLLIRRVEMLRTNDVMRILSPARSRAAKWCSLATIGVLAIAAAGLRSPAGGPVLAGEVAEAEPRKAAQPSAEKQAAAGYEFDYVPDDVVFLIAIRPSEIAASPRLRPLAKILGESMRPAIPPESLAQVTLAMPTPKVGPEMRTGPVHSTEYTVFRTNEPVDFKPFIEASYGAITSEDHDGREMITWGPSEYSIAYYAPDDRTLVSHPKAGLLNVISDPDAARAPEQAAAWQAEATGPLFAAVNMDAIRMVAAPNSVIVQMLRPAIDATERLIVTTEDAEPFVIRATATCKTADGVPIVKASLESCLLLLRNVLISQQILAAESKGPDAPTEQIRSLLELATKALETIEMKSDGRTLTVTASVENVGPVLGKIVIPAISDARQAARRVQSQYNLKQLALAMHMYYDKAGSMPPAVVYGPSFLPELNSTGAGDAAADVPRSWRVEILPLIEHVELYKQYRLDQPWDSEANLKVLSQIPQLYRAPVDAATSTNASYFALTGPGTVFANRDGTKFQEITDGMSNTLLFAEAKRSIPWTKPEDIAYDPTKPIPELGGWRQPGEFLMAMCDGSVHAMHDVDDAKLKLWIEMADDQFVPMPREAVGATPPAPQPGLAPETPAP